MTSKERIKLILNSVDKKIISEKPIGYFDIFSESALKRWRKEGLPVDVIPEEYFGIDIVLFGFRYIEESGFPEVDIKNINETDSGYVIGSKVYQRILSKNKYVCIGIPGPFQHVVSLYGYDRVFKALGLKENWIKEQFNKSIRYILGMIDLVGKTGFEFDGVWIWEDIACDDGLFFSVSQYRGLLGQFHFELIKQISELDKTVFFHSDGDIKSVLPVLVKNGIDAIHPLESKLYDLKELERKFPELVCMGGMDYRDFLNKTDIYYKTMANNNYIYSADSAIMGDISLSEYKQLSSLVRSQSYEYTT